MKRLSGATYEHKDAIRALGGTWDKESKSWILSAHEAEAIWARGCARRTLGLQAAIDSGAVKIEEV